MMQSPRPTPAEGSRGRGKRSPPDSEPIRAPERADTRSVSGRHDSARNRPPEPRSAADSRLDALHEQVASQRHGQSAYAPSGERSPDQRRHDAGEAMALLQRAAYDAGRGDLMRELGVRTRRELWRLRADALLWRIERERDEWVALRVAMAWADA